MESTSAKFMESNRIVWSILSVVVSRATESLNVTNSDLKTPLYIACEAHMPKTVKLLIEKGADVKCKCDVAGTLMHVCCSNQGNALLWPLQRS